MDVNGNGGITVAKIGQKLEDHIAHQLEEHKGFKLDLKEIKTDVAMLVTMMTEGKGKISRNFMLHKKHEEDHKIALKEQKEAESNKFKFATFVISISSFIATCVGFLINWIISKGGK